MALTPAFRVTLIVFAVLLVALVVGFAIALIVAYTARKQVAAANAAAYQSMAEDLADITPSEDELLTLRTATHIVYDRAGALSVNAEPDAPTRTWSLVPGAADDTFRLQIRDDETDVIRQLAVRDEDLDAEDNLVLVLLATHDHLSDRFVDLSFQAQSDDKGYAVRDARSGCEMIVADDALMLVHGAAHDADAIFYFTDLEERIA